jgi:hypothetical protein
VPGGQTSASVTIPDIPVGVVRSVNETPVPPGWALAGLEPDGGSVTITPGSPPASVTLTDQRTVSSLAVVKQTVGPVAGAGTVFTVLFGR